MKARFLGFMLLFAGLTTTVQAQTYDDVYGGSEQQYDSYSKKKKRQQQRVETQVTEDNYSNRYNDNYNDNVDDATSQRSYITDGDEYGEYSQQDDAESYEYATRIRRFYTPMYSAGYFSRFYWDPYWWDWGYTYPSWCFGSRGFGWGFGGGMGFGYPYGGSWGWNPYNPGFGWGNGLGGWGCGFGAWGNFYGPSYGSWGWNGFGYPYGGWGGGFGAWGYNNYWHGFYDGMVVGNNHYPNGNGYSNGPRRGMNSSAGLTSNGRRDYTPRDRSLTMQDMPNAFRGNTRVGVREGDRMAGERMNSNGRTQNPGYNSNNRNGIIREGDNNMNMNGRQQDRFQQDRYRDNTPGAIRQQETTPRNNGRFRAEPGGFDMPSAPSSAPQPERRRIEAAPPVRENRSRFESMPSRGSNESAPRSMPSPAPRSMPSMPSGGGGGSFRGGGRR